jgi:hypothetical protein
VQCADASPDYDPVGRSKRLAPDRADRPASIVELDGAFTSCGVTIAATTNFADASPNWFPVIAQRYDTGAQLTSYPAALTTSPVALLVPNLLFCNGLQVTLNSLVGTGAVNVRVRSGSFLSSLPASASAAGGLSFPTATADSLLASGMPENAVGLFTNIISSLYPAGSFDRLQGIAGAGLVVSPELRKLFEKLIGRLDMLIGYAAAIREPMTSPPEFGLAHAECELDLVN